MTLQRHQNWPLKLRLYLESHASTQFAWGTADCCTFVCDWISLASGLDVYGDFRGKYNTKLGAYKAIKSVTGGSDEEAAALYVTNKFGMKTVPVLFAQRGDVVLFDAPEGKRLGIVSLHPGRSVFLSDSGLKYEATAKCRLAWKV